MDPFRQIDQMMMGFGGLGSDPFFGDLMNFNRDPFEDMFKFSDSNSFLIQFTRTFTAKVYRVPMSAKAL